MVRLFKDEESTTDSEGNAVLTADVVETEMIYYDGLQQELQNNFEKYFSLGSEAEAEEIKEKKMEDIKQQLMKININYLNGTITEEEFNTQSGALKTEYGAL